MKTGKFLLSVLLTFVWAGNGFSASSFADRGSLTQNSATHEFTEEEEAPLSTPMLALSTSGTHASASWTASTGATGYRLFYAPYPNADYTGVVNMGTKTGFSMNLFEGAAFYIFVQAYNSHGASGYSDMGNYFVISHSLSITPSTLNLLADQTRNCNVSDGTGSSYSATSSNTAVATVAVNDGILYVTGVADGSATVTVYDSGGDSGTVSVSVGATVFGRIPDTGQTTCYNNSEKMTCPQPGEAFFGQDACYTINAPSYTKLDVSGNALPDSATSWTTVRDNVTGLIWEVKTDDGSIHDRDNQYTWQEAKDVFVSSLNSERFGGFSDWRVPTIKELTYLMDYGTYTPAINTDFFHYTGSSLYWSSTPYADDVSASYAWSIFSEYGYDYYFSYKLFTYYVRAVRGEQSFSGFVDNGNGTVTDTATGLMWQQATAPGEHTWREALSYCENFTLAGYTDWRLPTFKELRSIVDYSVYNPTIDTRYFPDTLHFYYWSSTPNAYNPYAWGIYFYQGDDSYKNKADPYYVRAVRGGER
jgi:hypothetical protein